MTEELVELTALDPSFVLDIKYARTDSFMGRVLYPSPEARPTAKAGGGSSRSAGPVASRASATRYGAHCVRHCTTHTDHTL